MPEDHMQKVIDALGRASKTADELRVMADRLPSRRSIWPQLIMNAVAAGIVALVVTLALR